jgi:hypothetical protein
VTMRRFMIARAFAVSAVAAVACLLAAPESAAENKAVPSISLEGGWDSNIFNSSTDDVSDVTLRARPGLELFFDAFQTTGSVSAFLEFEKFIDNTELEDNPSTIDLRLSAAKPMRIAPRFSFSPYLGFLETTDSWRRNQLISPPTPGIPPADQIVVGRSKQKYYLAGLRMDYLVSPRVDFSLGGGATKTDRLPSVTDPDPEDSRTIFGDTTVTYRFNPRLSAGVYFSANVNSWDRSPDTRVLSGGMTGTYEIAERYTLTGRAGVAHYSEDAGPASEGTDDWTPTGSVSFVYAKKDFSVNLAASTEPSGGSGFGVITDRLTVYLSLTDQFAEGWWWDLSGSYQRNKSIDQPTDETIDTWWGAAGIRYTATKWASLYIKGDIYRQRDSAGAEGDIDRETVYAGVEFSTFFLY